MYGRDLGLFQEANLRCSDSTVTKDRATHLLSRIVLTFEVVEEWKMTIPALFLR